MKYLESYHSITTNRHFLAILIATLGGLSVQQQAGAATILGGNFGGADLVVNNGDILSGTFTNVGTFNLGNGVTVTLAAGVPLMISAQTISIGGWLNGNGAGFAGGITGGANSANGVAGLGTGGGAGGNYGDGIHASGGGGGGYGAAGGNSGQSLSDPLAAMGGNSYDSYDSGAIFPGSGGGSAGNHFDSGLGGNGGAGGGAITLISSNLSVLATGLVSVDGSNGLQGNLSNYGVSTSGGGGGSGGGILLMGDLDLVGTLSAIGGDGASFNGPSGWYGQGGGGGAGGRIQIYGTSITDPGFQSLVEGGAAGVSDLSTLIMAQSGGNGTFYDATTISAIPEPGSVVPLACLLSSCLLFRFRHSR